MPQALRRFGQVYALLALLTCSAPSAIAQSPASRGNSVRLMTLNQTRYRLQAGESARIATPVLRSITAVSTVPNLRFPIRASMESDGQSVHFTVPPTTPKGTYILTFVAVDSAGAVRTGAVDLRITPMQLPRASGTGTGVPVVLLNGWQAICTTTESTIAASVDTFGQLAYQLQDQGLPVAFFNNCSYGDIQIEALGAELGTFLNGLTYTDGTPILQFDLVTHSMGGLIARAYLAGLQNDGSPSPPVNPNVGKLIMIACPNFGSFQAFDLGVQAPEMIPGSAFLYNLARWNQGADDLRGVDALAIIGNAGTEGGLPNASDGVVSLTSGSLGFTSQSSQKPVQTRIVPYCHVDPNLATSLGIGMSCSGAGGIAYVTDGSQLSGQIVSSFLAGNSDWMAIGGTPPTDPYLSVYGGMFFALANSADQYVTDLTQVSWGSVALQTGGVPGTVFYDEFLSGTGTFQLTSSSLGTVPCGSFTEPSGYYSVARCKSPPLISSVTPRQDIAGQGLIVTSFGVVTINGVGFGQQCPSCQLLLSGSLIQAFSWTDSAISVLLPPYTGFATFAVEVPTGSDSINVMLAPASTIAVTPASLRFAYTTTGAVPAPQSVQLSNTGGGTLAWSAITNASWLAVTPSSGTGPSTLSVSVSPAGLSAGTYMASIQISAAGATNSPVAVAITLTVTAPGPASLAVAPQKLMYSYTVGGAAPAPQTLSITNTGGGTLSWAASVSANWLLLSATSGTAPATLSVSVNPAGIAPGSYSATVEVSATGANGSPASIPVALTVQAAQPPFTVKSATAGQIEPFAPDSIVAAYGAILATGTAGATVVPLPTSLDGNSVTVTDSADVARLAPLFYVSPAQVNFEIPEKGAPPQKDDPLLAAHEFAEDGWQVGAQPGPTAVLEHGANPGLISHFTKQGLIDIGNRSIKDGKITGQAADEIRHSSRNGNSTGWRRSSA